MSGKISTTVNNIRSYASPMGEGDVFRWVQSLPGVSAGAEGTSAMYVRGGNGGGNVLSIDGVPIYGYNHMLGMTSILSSDIIAGAFFVKEGFGGSFGNFTSSHIDIRTIAPSRQYRKMSITMSNFMAGASTVIPMGEKASLIVSGRISPFSLEYKALKGLMGGGLGDLDNFKAGVADAYTKFVYQINTKNTISLFGLGSIDKYAYSVSDGSVDTFGWYNIIGAAQFRSQQNWIIMELAVSFNKYESFQKQDKMFNGKKNNFSSKSGLQEITLSADGVIPIGRHFSLESGVKMRMGTFGPSLQNATTPTKHSVLVSEYALGKFKSKYLDIVASARLNQYKVNHSLLFIYYNVPDYDFSAHIHPVPCLTVSASFDKTSQYYHTLEGIPLGWSVDLIVPSTLKMPVETLQQWYIGADLHLGNHTLSAGCFSREMDNLGYFKDASSLFTGARDNWENEIDLGKGESEGVELIYSYESGELYAFATATISKSVRKGFAKINEGKPFHAPFDRRLVLNTSVEWRRWNIAFVYQDGNWVNGAGEQYVANVPGYDPITLEYYEGINNHQMPATVRLDLSYRIDWKTQNLSHELKIGVCNLFNHFNPFTIYYDSDTKEWKELALLPVLPTFCYRILFEKSRNRSAIRHLATGDEL
ncbi:MAG: hypothetical protein ACI4A2_02565 [Candidatus Cryptobacteroides sp.]